MVPDAVNLDSVHRILVVKLRHHGDVLLTSPVFQVLRNRAPAAEIDALVYEDTREMLEGHPSIARIHGIDRGWKRQGLASQARHEGPAVTRVEWRIPARKSGSTAGNNSHARIRSGHRPWPRF